MFSVLRYVYVVRFKIPFAAAMMDVSLRSMSTFPSSWFLPILGMFLMAGLAVVWSICAMSIIYAVDHGSNQSVYSVRGIIFFLLVLSLFWTILCIKSWVHVCIAGVQATWYFLAPHAVPKHPVWGAVKRASTTSFGSICFGSFIVAFIRTVRFFVNMAYQQARSSRNALAVCALCILECLLGILESIINYINQYAFAICAIYGSVYILLTDGHRHDIFLFLFV
jgi:ABC-type multidrug transport system fused ATPase/permease subunit